MGARDIASSGVDAAGSGAGPGAAGSGVGAAGAGPGAAGSGPGAAGSGPGAAGSGPGAAGSGPGAAGSGLGRPRVHLRVTDSTNTVARALAAGGAPHGTLVTAREQRAGRGRQGRAWSAPPGTALLCSWVIRDPSALLSLAAGVAVAELCGERAQLKWPNDVLIDARKVSGILVEGRPQERWAVLGIGINVALRPEQLPPELRDRAGTLGLTDSDIEPTLERMQGLLAHWLAAPDADVLEAVRARDALRGRHITWDQGAGTAAGIDDSGRLLVNRADGSSAALDAGEVHLGPISSS